MNNVNTPAKYDPYTWLQRRVDVDEIQAKWDFHRFSHSVSLHDFLEKLFVAYEGDETIDAMRGALDSLVDGYDLGEHTLYRENGQWVVYYQDGSVAFTSYEVFNPVLANVILRHMNSEFVAGQQHGKNLLAKELRNLIGAVASDRELSPGGL